MSDQPSDAYFYARYHEGGPGAWCVIGPRGFEMTAPELNKCTAYVIGKVLSGEYKQAIDMLQTLAGNATMSDCQ